VIDLFMKPSRYASYTITFARGRMVLAYSARRVAGKTLPPISEVAGQAQAPPAPAPRATSRWYEILTSPGVSIGASHPFLDPGGYRADMIFQLAEAYYRVPGLYNRLLGHVMIAGPDRSGTPLGDRFDFQFTYEHIARAMAASNPDARYVELPDELNLSDPGRDADYRNRAVVVLPGLGAPQGERTIAVPARRLAWGITMMTGAPHPENAVRFLQFLLGRNGTSALATYGPVPMSPALVSEADYRNLPEVLRPLVLVAAR
jgi:molybdate/tungstate transport system substrate-binding protein